MGTKKATADKPDPTRDAPDIVKKVEHLISLATNNDSENEAGNSALAAIRLMQEHELVVIPKTHLDQVQKVVQGAQELMATAKKNENQKLFLGLAVGALFGGPLVRGLR